MFLLKVDKPEHCFLGKNRSFSLCISERVYLLDMVEVILTNLTLDLGDLNEQALVLFSELL